MRLKNLPSLFALIAGPVAVLASPAADRRIENAAESSYNYRAVLEDHVKAKASDGAVELTGTVRDEDEKYIAGETLEHIPGVVSVNNQVMVEPAYLEHSDRWMAFKIHGRLLVKANVSAVTTTVVVQDGVATLGGTADSLVQKELAEAYAKDIDGVKRVKNEIMVNDASPRATIRETIDDASVASQVDYALLSHKYTRELKIKVTATDGAVRITGDANSKAEKSLVTKLASDVRGAKSVINDIEVKT